MSVRKIGVKENSGRRKAEVHLKLSEFEIPPMRDILVIGKRAPIGIEAAKRMASAVSPKRFIIIPVNDKTIEAIMLREALLQLVPKKRLISMVTEEAGKIMQKEDVIKVDIDVDISVKRIIEL